MFEDLEPQIDFENEYYKQKNKVENLKKIIQEKDFNILQTDRKLAEYIQDCDSLSKIIRGFRKRVGEITFDDLVKEIVKEHAEIKDFVFDDEDV